MSLVKSLKVWRLIGLGALLALGAGGCGWLIPPEPIQPKTHSAENEWVRFARTALPQVEAGTVFPVRVTLEAKQDLPLMAVSETVPDGFTLVEGALTAFRTDASAGDLIELTYKLRAGSPGEFALEGTARVKPAGSDSVPLDLVSPLKVVRP